MSITVTDLCRSGAGSKRYFQLFALRNEGQVYTGEVSVWSACYREDLEFVLQEVLGVAFDTYLVLSLWELYEGLYWSDLGTQRYIQWHRKHFPVSLDGVSEHATWESLIALFVSAMMQSNIEVSIAAACEIFAKSIHARPRKADEYHELRVNFCQWMESAPTRIPENAAQVEELTDWQREALELAHLFEQGIDRNDEPSEDANDFVGASLSVMIRVLHMVSGDEEALFELTQRCGLDHLWWLCGYLYYVNHRTLRVDRWSLDATVRSARADFTSAHGDEEDTRLFDLVEEVTQGLLDDQPMQVESFERVLTRIAQQHGESKEENVESLESVLLWIRVHMYDVLVNPYHPRCVYDVRKRDDAIQRYATHIAAYQPLLALKYLSTAPMVDPSALVAIIDQLIQEPRGNCEETIRRIRCDLETFLSPALPHRRCLAERFCTYLGAQREKWLRVYMHGNELYNEAMVHLLRRIAEGKPFATFLLYAMEIKQRDYTCTAVDTLVFQMFQTHHSLKELRGVGAAMQRDMYDPEDVLVRTFEPYVVHWLKLCKHLYLFVDECNEDSLAELLENPFLPADVLADVLTATPVAQLSPNSMRHLRWKLYELKCVSRSACAMEESTQQTLKSIEAFTHQQQASTWHRPENMEYA